MILFFYNLALLAAWWRCAVVAVADGDTNKYREGCWSGWAGSGRVGAGRAGGGPR